MLSEVRKAMDTSSVLLDHIDAGRDDVIFFADEGRVPGRSVSLGTRCFPPGSKALSATAPPEEYADADQRPPRAPLQLRTETKCHCRPPDRDAGPNAGRSPRSQTASRSGLQRRSRESESERRRERRHRGRRVETGNAPKINAKGVRRRGASQGGAFEPRLHAGFSTARNSPNPLDAASASRSSRMNRRKLRV